jgi:hypothetical protein
VVDLSQYAGSEVSGDDDLICFWVGWGSYFTTLKSIEIRLDCKSGGVPDYITDYYLYEITPTELEYLAHIEGLKSGEKAKKSVTMEIKKSSFKRIGTTSSQDWADICGVRFTVNTGKGYAIKVYFDNLYMKRRQGLTGIYQFCTVFVNSAGEKSAPSEWSDQVTLNGSKAALSLIPLSADSDVVERWIFRKGGALGSDARLDTVINDNTTTSKICYLSDVLLGSLLDSEDIPQGTIRVPLGAKWGPKFRGRGIIYRIPGDLRSLYYSNINYLYAWSELQGFTIDSEIMDIFVKEDVLYLNTKSGIKRVTSDLSNISYSDVQETGLVKYSMSPYGSAQVDENWAYVSYDGVYLFSGYNYKLISEPVKNYFDMANYDNTLARMIYANKHLYVSVKKTVAGGGTRYLLDCYIPKMSWSYSDITCESFCKLFYPC